MKRLDEIKIILVLLIFFFRNTDKDEKNIFFTFYFLLSPKTVICVVTFCVSTFGFQYYRARVYLFLEVSIVPDKRSKVFYVNYNWLMFAVLQNISFN